MHLYCLAAGLSALRGPLGVSHRKEGETEGRRDERQTWLLAVLGGRYDVNRMRGLLIRNVTEDDNGDYTCRAEVEAEGRYDERKISLVVHSM